MITRLRRPLSLILLLMLTFSSIPAAQASAARLLEPETGSESQAGITLRLANAVFDPLVTGAPAGLPLELLQGATATAATAQAAAYYLVQFDGPVTEQDFATLTGAGAAVFDYIPDFAYIVRLTPQARAAVEGQMGVRWTGIYQPAYRLSSELLALSSYSETATAAQTQTSNGGKRLLALTGDPAREIVAELFPGEPLTPTVVAVQGWGGQVLDRSETAWGSKLKLALPTSRIAAPVWELTNNKATDVMGGRVVWNTHGLRGTGQIVAVADTGLDRGSTNPTQLHDDFENGSGATRVAVIHDRVGDGGNDVNSGHGTHVAGSVLGNGKLSGANPAAHNYPASAYPGLAPEATLVFQAIENNNNGSLSGLPLDLNELFAQAAASGARIHTNSWGSNDAGAYTTEAQDADEYAWDHKDFTILFAAGNSAADSNADGRIDNYSMNSPASAKNVITVGASENNRPPGSVPTPGYDTPWGSGSWLTTYPVNPIRDDHVSNNVNGMAAFSSRGPTLDGRIKPDIVAPGTNIASALSSVASEEGWGGINANYTFNGGTSMATPLAAGATALIRQFYTDQKGITPSAALLKATLVNGAANMAPGQYGTGGGQEIANSRPTNAAGWGRVDLGASLFPAAPRTMRYHDEKPGLTTGNSRTYRYSVTSSAQPLRVTLAWTDYPGSAAAGGGLVNDLDLHIVGPGGATYYPNNANPRAATQHLAYDSGAPTGFYSWEAGKRVAVRFTPTQYPADLQSARFYLGAASSSNLPQTVKWSVYNGNTSGPTSVVASGTTVIRKNGWHTVDLTAHNIRINGGDFFLAIELSNSILNWGYDRSSPIDGRSWDFDGSSWVALTVEDYMLQAVLTSPISPTPHDRVNNLQGIDIANPGVGEYRIVVHGYNVPRGPQPFALVVSGAIADPALPASHKTYLPLVMHKYPPVPDAPVLNPIANGDGDGNYTVTWNAAPRAVSYTLVEDDNPAFNSPTTVYGPGTGTSWQAAGKAQGTYHYRVLATNTWGNGPWSNTQSVTVTPPIADPIVNGTFEAGPNGWTQYSTHNDPLIINAGFPGSIQPHSGTWAAWLGGLYDDISYVKQQVTIPAGSPYLVYWHWIASADTCGYDFGGVLINDTVVRVYNLCSSADTNGWVRQAVDLAAYAGQRVWVQIRSETDSSANSNLFVDDVSFQASANAAQEPADVAPQQSQPGTGWTATKMPSGPAADPLERVLGAPAER